MKTGLTALLAIVLLASFTGMVYAQPLQPTVRDPISGETFQQKVGKAKVQNFEGTVLSHDVGCHCIVLRTGKGNITLQDDYAKFEGDYNRAKGVNIGSKIRGTYKTVDYINYALAIDNI